MTKAEAREKMQARVAELNRLLGLPEDGPHSLVLDGVNYSYRVEVTCADGKGVTANIFGPERHKPAVLLPMLDYAIAAIKHAQTVC
jgi:hypothetical protein